MKFHAVISNLTRPKERPLSKIYGYRKDRDAGYLIEPNEARVIKSVITALATRSLESVDSIFDDLLKQFASTDIRNRSAQRWTRKTILALIRPIYSGSVVSKFGVWRRSRLYPQIVDQNSLKIAIRRLNGLK